MLHVVSGQSATAVCAFLLISSAVVFSSYLYKKVKFVCRRLFVCLWVSGITRKGELDIYGITWI